MNNSKRSIDLNADVGEGGDFDQSLLQIVSSANISCGAHAGNLQTITAAISYAMENDVAIGAHPGYPDLLNFGRLPSPMRGDELRATLLTQLEHLQTLLSAAGATLVHVKPHGALYNQAATDTELAEELTAILREFDTNLVIVALAGSELLAAAARAGSQCKAEAFADRLYQADGTLLPRTMAGAVIDSSQHALRQSLQIIEQGTVTAHDGQIVSLQAQTLCLHGDNPHALLFAENLQQALIQAGIRISAD